MWGYDKKLQYPVNIKNPNPKMAKFIISQYGGPDGELAASLRYLSQRFSMPTEITKATLNDIGTEELRTLGNGWNASASINKRCITGSYKKRRFRRILYRSWYICISI